MTTESNPPKQVGDPRTRQKLVEAARKVFTEKTFLDAKVDDILQEAGLARGTYYMYFKNKEDIFEHLVDQAVEDMLREVPVEADQDIFTRMKLRNRTYLEAFNRHVGVLRNLYLVASFNPRVAAFHQRLQKKFIARIRQRLEKSMRSAEKDQINLDVASWGLGLMVESFVHLWLAAKGLPEGDSLEADDVVNTLSSLMYRAIFLEESCARDSLVGATESRKAGDSVS